MAPTPGHTVDHTPEYEAFIAKLREYHANRGTNFEPEPKVGQTPVDLLKLFNTVVDQGGYDRVSEEKLAWRNVVNALELYSNNEASAAYSLKLAYYKNLAAYEIRTVHNQEPPPPEILEHISAKGGNLLTRTLENFHGAHRIGTRAPGAHDSPAGSVTGDETPARAMSAAADGTPATGRASRGLREAPPQRVIFQPDTAPARQTRHASGAPVANGHGHGGHGGPGTPQPNGAGHTSATTAQRVSMLYNPPNTDTFSATVHAYEPRGPHPVALHPVKTPATSGASFLHEQRVRRLEASGISLEMFAKRPPVPSGFDGPNIYVRCLGALRSGLRAEEAFALSHLVKISYERGDKYKFENFPGLAEGLFDKALQVGSLYYHDIAWRVSYDVELDDADPGELDGVHGTPDILERIARLRPKDAIDSLETEDVADQMTLITEAALTIRNMMTLPDNAFFVADVPTCRDFLCIALCLPERDAVVELKHCALDIAESVTPFMTLGDADPLYQTLLAQLDSADRGIVLSALRAVGRISMNMAQTNRLGRVPAGVLHNIQAWLLLNDDELVDACLDFLYQFTAEAANVAQLLQTVRAEGLVAHLVRLLSHGATTGWREVVLAGERTTPATDRVLAPPAELFATLFAMDEPERCYAWLRCFFEQDAASSITQIDIWQAYQAAFMKPVLEAKRTMLGAAEFIRNVTHVYHAAGAQIQKERDAQGVETQKFIIKGIRPRTRPVSPTGDAFFRCQWAAQPGKTKTKNKVCGVFFGTAAALYAHVLTEHLDETPGADGKVANKEVDAVCRWAGCSKYANTGTVSLAALMQHVKTHAVQAEQDARPHGTVADPDAKDKDTDKANANAKDAPGGHQRQRSSVTNGDIIAAGTGQLSSSTASEPSPSSRPAERSFVVPAQTMSVAYEETPTVRDERNPGAPAQAAGIPLSAVLVLRNMARNAGNAGNSKADTDADAEGWNERLFRPVLARLYEVMADNRALAPYVASVIELASSEV